MKADTVLGREAQVREAPAEWWARDPNVSMQHANQFPAQRVAAGPAALGDPGAGLMRSRAPRRAAGPARAGKRGA